MGDTPDNTPPKRSDEDAILMDGMTIHGNDTPPPSNTNLNETPDDEPMPEWKRNLELLKRDSAELLEEADNILKNRPKISIDGEPERYQESRPDMSVLEPARTSGGVIEPDRTIEHTELPEPNSVPLEGYDSAADALEATGDTDLKIPAPGEGPTEVGAPFNTVAPGTVDPAIQNAPAANVETTLKIPGVAQ